MFDAESLTQAFGALGDKTRYRLFEMLGTKPDICVGELAHELRISSAAVSQHMKILADAGLVHRIRDGQRVCYQIANDSPITQAFNSFIFSTKEEGSHVG